MKTCECGKEFEPSKFTPYVTKCPECRGTTKKAPKSKEEPIPLNSKAEVAIKGVVTPLGNKEKAFVYLFSKGYRLSSNNLPYKEYTSGRVIASFGKDSAKKKFCITSQNKNGFGGSAVITSSDALKDYSKEIREDLLPIFDTIAKVGKGYDINLEDGVIIVEVPLS